MKQTHLSTDSYKGVRDFYPEDMAIQRYIFDMWSRTAESFGFERYDASILEPADLYRAKGAANEEMVNEQTYTFVDRGEREVTLRPEMTPTIARMVAKKARALSYPLRWYSIPNLFRYERPQKGRLREHWQLNCDIFGAADFSAEVEMIALAQQTLIDMGATPDMFEIRVNDRHLMERLYLSLGVNEATIPAITRLNDRKNKIDSSEYREELQKIVQNDTIAEEIIIMLEKSDEQTDVVVGLAELGITNVVFDKSLARGFDYYTGTIFEIFDVSGENNRSLLGGGRYDNLTSMFDEDPISGIGFGMGDVTMRDFLETHKLLPTNIKNTAADVVVIPWSAKENLPGQTIAHQIRQVGLSASTDMGTQKIGKRIGTAGEKGAKFVIVIGEDEVTSGNLTVKNLNSGEERSGQLSELINFMSVA
jgi:histidyl-tRNA synthetase